MKLVHISDIHMHAGPIGGNDPVGRFRACLAHVGRHNGDADRIVITGDLADTGAISEYEILKAVLAEVPFGGKARPRLMVGNHDNRDNFQAVFPEVPRDEHGFVQYVEESAVGRFIHIDTLGEDIHEGRLDMARQAWLGARLDEAAADGVFVWLFMHHNPVPVGVLTNDPLGIYETPELVSLLEKHQQIIRHIFFGHTHYVLSGSVAGIPFSGPCSTSEPCAPEFSGRTAIGTGPLRPTYNVVFISERDTIVHSIDFLADETMNWHDIDMERWRPQIRRMQARGIADPDW